MFCSVGFRSRLRLSVCELMFFFLKAIPGLKHTVATTPSLILFESAEAWWYRSTLLLKLRMGKTRSAEPKSLEDVDAALLAFDDSSFIF